MNKKTKRKARAARPFTIITAAAINAVKFKKGGK